MRILLAAIVALTLALPLQAQVGANRDGLRNPNLATAEQLAGLGELDAAAVDAIIAGRPHLSMAAVHEIVVSHVPADAVEALYRKFWLPINLNDVTDGEILLIPGVGDRMLHEFEEYRPYRALAEFQREMGKYVDDEEVARLSQYVFVPLDLNTASEEDFQTIPGVGARMSHEFEEYRPWRAKAQFEREIGKYVDDAEVARLWRYVVIGG